MRSILFLLLPHWTGRDEDEGVGIVVNSSYLLGSEDYSYQYFIQIRAGVLEKAPWKGTTECQQHVAAHYHATCPIQK